MHAKHPPERPPNADAALQQLARSRMRFADMFEGAPDAASNAKQDDASRYDPSPTTSRARSASDDAKRTGDSNFTPLFDAFKSALDAHPISKALTVAEPVLAGYAKERPWTVVSVAAVLGAAVVAVRPWRYVAPSVGIAGLLQPNVLANTWWKPLIDSFNQPRRSTKDER